MGPHPPPERIGARQPARHRRGAARRDPLAGGVRREQLPHAARARRAARDLQAHARRPTASRCGCTSCSSSTARCRRCRCRRPQSQYETAAVQIPLIESQIAQTENSLSVLVGPQPGTDSARQVDLRPRAAEGARGRAVRAADAAAGPAAGRGHADRGQRADRRGARPVFPDDLADRRRRHVEQPS